MRITEKIEGSKNTLDISFIETNEPRMRIDQEPDGDTVRVTVRGPKKELKRWYDDRVKKKFDNKDSYDKRKTKSKLKIFFTN
jgi:hypothetical protein|tara:strand:- start:300 stop:545 length:246 start_codon:yes stop_codon:yes gene_type:complete